MVLSLNNKIPRVMTRTIVFKKLRKTYDSAEARKETPEYFVSKRARKASPNIVEAALIKIGAPTAYKAFLIRSSAAIPSPYSNVL